MNVTPTRAQISAAAGATVPDVIAPDLAILLCGINPGLYSGAVGHHFARPGNRLWRTLHAAGLTPRILTPFEERELLRYGIGITNLVQRATATADEIDDAELVAGVRRLEQKVARFRPRCAAFLGLNAYRVGRGRRRAAVGRQPERFAGATAWLLPNPSGLNAHYQLPDLARLYGELRAARDAGTL